MLVWRNTVEYKTVTKHLKIIKKNSFKKEVYRQKRKSKRINLLQKSALANKPNLADSTTIKSITKIFNDIGHFYGVINLAAIRTEIGGDSRAECAGEE